MTGRKRSKRICAILLSLILFFGSVSEYMFPLYADAAGEDADDDISKDDYNEADEEKPSGESDEDDEAAVSAEDEPEDPSVSDNESIGGGEDPGETSEDGYPYSSPADDPAYKENEVWVSEIDDSTFIYDGSSCKPHPYVFYDMQCLKEGRDYTLSWGNTVNAYQCDNKEHPSADDFEKAPRAVISMKGNFSSTTMAFYNIYPRDISTGDFESAETTLIYTGKKLDYTPQLLWNTKKLKYKSDYNYEVYDMEKDESREITDNDLTGDPAKDTSLIIRINGKGNFKGMRYTQLTITPAENAVSIDKLKISAIPIQKYNAEVYTADNLLKKGKPYEIKVTYGKTLLKKDVDYIAYVTSEALYPGKYSVLIKGNGTPGTEGLSFVGEKLINLTIEGSIKDAVVSGVAASYDTPEGAEYVRPDEALVSLSINGKELPAKYIDISYKKDDKAGTASIVFKGKNGFKGKKSVKYKINGRSIEGLTAEISAAFYRKNGTIPSVVIKDGSKELINGVNYTCSFKNNKKYNASKKPVAIIKGKGLYTGKKSVEFEIIKSIPDLSKGYELTVQDRVYSPKPGAYTTKISFKDPDGKKLKEGVDFDVLYMNTSNEALAKDHVVNVGETIVARITTKGGYTDNTFDKEFRIIGKGLDISKATVSVRSQIFKESVDGVRLPVDDETITVKINGQKLHRIEDGHFVDPAVEGELNGFSVIEDSYKDNHKCGTAGVMIRGVGIYGGIRTIRFTIKPKEVKGIDPSKKYIPAPDKYISVLDFGATAGDGTDDTGAIMNAISAASADTENDHNLYFPAGVYNVGQTGTIDIGVPNVHITMDADAELYVAKQGGDGYNVIHIHDDDVSIRGGKINGERFRHSGGSVGQYGMGITITYGKNITIRDMVICNNRGDGIYINDNAKGTVKNVTVKDCDIYDNSRNNICVIRGDYITIENCHIHHEKDGHSPMAGIDLEPDMKVGQVKEEKKVKHVVIKGCKIETYQHCSAHINDMGLWAYYGIMIIYGFGEPVVEDVRIENCEIYGDLSIGSSKDVKIINTKVHGETLPGDC